MWATTGVRKSWVRTSHPPCACSSLRVSILACMSVISLKSSCLSDSCVALSCSRCLSRACADSSWCCCRSRWWAALLAWSSVTSSSRDATAYTHTHTHTHTHGHRVPLHTWLQRHAASSAAADNMCGLLRVRTLCVCVSVFDCAYLLCLQQLVPQSPHVLTLHS